MSSLKQHALKWLSQLKWAEVVSTFLSTKSADYPHNTHYYVHKATMHLSRGLVTDNRLSAYICHDDNEEEEDEDNGPEKNSGDFSWQFKLQH